MKKKYQNKFNKLKKTAKKLYHDNKLSEYKGNLKTTWKLNEIIIIHKRTIKSSIADKCITSLTITNS